MRDWILIRHGQSEANAGATTDTNSRLSAKGLLQSRSAAESLSLIVNENWRVVSSPFLRTIETSAIICSHLGLPVSFDHGLREFDEANVLGVFYKKESHREFFTRLFRFIVDHGDKDKLLLVCHGGVISSLSQIFTDRQPDAASWGGVENCEIRRFRVSDDTVGWVKRNLSEITE